MERGGRRDTLPLPQEEQLFTHAREGLVVPGVAVVEVHVLRIAEESEVDGDEGLGGLGDERSFHDDTGIRERTERRMRDMADNLYPLPPPLGEKFDKASATDSRRTATMDGKNRRSKS